MELHGTEVKSMRQGRMNLKESFAIVKDGEIFGVGEGETYVYVYASKDSSVGVPRARIRVKVGAEK